MSQLNDGEDQSSTSPRLSSKEREVFQRRSLQLGRKLDALKVQKAPPVENRMSGGVNGAATSQGFKIAVELLVGVCFGGFVGWNLDRYFETSGPWFLIVFVILGFAAGMLNVIRIAQRIQADVESQKNEAQSIDKSDEQAKND